MIYNNKHVVFEQVGVESDTYVWNQSTNTDGDGCSNNYDISNMRNSVLPTITTKISSALYAVLTNTTIQTAKNGLGSTLVSTSDKLFLPAGKEIDTSGTNCVSAENNALTTWTYWTTHTNASDRKKYDSTSTARAYWLRSPNYDSSNRIVRVSSGGDFGNYAATSGYWIATCFAF